MGTNTEAFVRCIKGHDFLSAFIRSDGGEAVLVPLYRFGVTAKGVGCWFSLAPVWFGAFDHEGRA